MAEAADIATNALLAFRLEAFSLNSVTDALAFTAAQSNTNVQQLAQAFRYAAPFAAALGFSVNEVAAAIGRLSDTGIQATLAGNSLANVFRSLAKRGDNFNSVLDELGLTLQDVDPELNSFVDILRAFERAGATTNQIIRAFQIRGGRAVAALINRGVDELEALTNAIDNADFSALDVAATRINNVAGQLLLLKSQLSAIAASVFDSIREDVQDFLSVVSEALRALRLFIKENPEITKATVQILAFAAAASAAFAALLVLVSGPVSLAGIIALFVTFGGTLAPIAAALAALTPALAGIAAGFTTMGYILSQGVLKNLDAFKDVLTTLVTAVKGFAENFVRAFRESFGVNERLIEIFGEHLGGLLLVFNRFLKQVF